MSFTLNTFQFARGVATCPNNGNGVGTVTHGYKSATDNYVTITTTGYFPDNIDGSDDKIFVGDLITVVASDTVGLVLVTGLAPFTVGANLLGTAGSPITISGPIAATDGNGAKITGSNLQLEIADQAHPGILTIGAQAFAGTKLFMSGIQLLTSGGTPATLNDYEEFELNTTFTIGLEFTASVDLSVTQVGRQITISNTRVDGEVFGAPQGSPGVAFVANTALPARFRPTHFAQGYWLVSNAGVSSEGLVNIDSSGVIRIYNNANKTTAYTSAQINGFLNGSITYSI
jgi:hypothetical protein